MEKILGNIITKPIDMRMITDKVGFINYTSEPEKKIETLPTLIIGWKYTQSLYPNNNLSILKQDLDDNTWWCFSQTEKRSKYLECVETFYENIIENIISKLNYTFLNIFTDNFGYIKDVLSIIKSTIPVKCYVHYNSFMYIHFNNEVVGINLEDIEYIGVEKKKIIQLFYNYPNNKIFYDYNFIHKDILKILKNDMYLIPYFK